jgi:anti-anti-sigma regulatory factor
VQKGAIGLSSADVDVLLRGVDLLGKISASTRDPSTDLAQQYNSVIQALVSELKAVLRGEGKSSGVSTSGASPAVVQAAPSQAPKSEAAAASGPSPPASDITIFCPEILDATAAEEIRNQFLDAIASQSATIRFDLGATRDLDVQGLALLAAVPKHLAEHSRSSLQVVRISGEMATVLRVTGLSEPYGVRRSP